MSPKFQQLDVPTVESPLIPNESFAYYDHIDQCDLVPTISALLGNPIPKNSVGVTIYPIVQLWEKPDERYRLVHENALQLYDLLNAATSIANMSSEVMLRSGLMEVEHLWKTCDTLEKDAPSDAINQCRNFAAKAQKILSKAASNYNIVKMYLGFFATLLSVICLSYGLQLNFFVLQFSHLSYTFVALAYATMMFASSFVEEEQQFWYWLTVPYWTANTVLRLVNSSTTQA